MKFVDGINAYKTGEMVTLDIDKKANEVIIKSYMRKAPAVHLPISKITHISLDTEQEIIEKNKSVVGRAAIGTLLAGPVGALIGGMSGIGTKKKNKEKVILTIEYTDGTLVFMEEKSISVTDFYNRLRECLPQNHVVDENGDIRL